MDLPTEIVAILAHFAPLLSHRVWPHAQTLLLGAILVNGRRTVASALRIMGLAQEPHYTNYHRVLNRDAWSARAASRILLGLIVAIVPAGAPIILATDDTIERRNGRLIAAKGCYRDPVRSSRRHTILCFGLKWVAMSVMITVPWSERVWALPFLTALSWPEGRGPYRRHKTSIDWARQMGRPGPSLASRPEAGPGRRRRVCRGRPGRLVPPSRGDDGLPAAARRRVVPPPGSAAGEQARPQTEEGL